MKFINPSVEIWEQDVTNHNTLVEAMWAHIARCVRVCYQVDKPKNNETEEEYVRRVIFRNPDERLANHYSVLEHGAVYFSIEFPDEINGDNIDDELYELANMLLKYNKFNKVKKEDTKFTHIWHISTNLRVLVEHDIMWALKYAVPFNPEWHTCRVTVSFITNIGVARELNRHRTHSISEESTRYCNYAKNRFGNELTFILPTWITEAEFEVYINELNNNNLPSNLIIDNFVQYLYKTEQTYINLIKHGWAPQQAREILPLATKVQTIHTAFIDDWWDFLKLRHDEVSGPAHPNAKVIADMLSDRLHCMFSNNG